MNFRVPMLFALLIADILASLPSCFAVNTGNTVGFGTFFHDKRSRLERER
jgi:hypothetical protein